MYTFFRLVRLLLHYLVAGSQRLQIVVTLDIVVTRDELLGKLEGRSNVSRPPAHIIARSHEHEPGQPPLAAA